jgi:hypothetical protein
MRRLAKVHGDGPLRDALRMVDKRRNRSAAQFDGAGHKRAAVELAAGSRIRWTGAAPLRTQRNQGCGVNYVKR